MKRFLFFLFFLVFVGYGLYSQNVGQSGDTLINYVDINGLKQGYWEKKYPNGKIKYQARFKNDVPVGVFKRYYTNGQLFAYIIYDDEGKGTGDATYYWDDGKLLAKGKLINIKQKQGLWKIYNVQGVLLSTVNYDKGKMNGLKTTFYHSGKVAEKINYVDGKKDGKMVRYFENGKVSLVMNYKNGAFDGEVLSYYPDGRLKVKGAYKDDLKDGVWEYYDEKGSLIRKIEYVKGKAKNEKELDEELTKMLKELEKESYKYKEPDVEDFFNPRFGPRTTRPKNNRSLDEY